MRPQIIACSSDALSTSKGCLLPENMLILTNIRVARVALDIRILLANSSGDFFVPHVDTGMSLLGDQVGWSGYELCRGVGKQQSGRHSGHSRISHHLGSRKQSLAKIPYAKERPGARLKSREIHPGTTAEKSHLRGEAVVLLINKLSIISTCLSLSDQVIELMPVDRRDPSLITIRPPPFRFRFYQLGRSYRILERGITY